MSENPHPKYFDYNATTPLCEPAREAWIEASDRHWHNPSGLYREAGMARLQLEDYREELADLLGCDDPGRIVFTGGATEANNAVIRHFRKGGKRIAYSAIEHPCVLSSLEALFEKEDRTGMPVDPLSGRVGVTDFEHRLGKGDIDAVSVMAANNETGATQPWREIADLCRGRGIPFHCDAAQWFGKLPTDGFDACGFVSASAHKFGGPKGVGFLMIPEGMEPGEFEIFKGGAQENGFRAGTEDLAGIAAMMAAFENIDETLDIEAKANDRDAFEMDIESRLGCELLLRDCARLWNTSMFVLPHTKNVKWLARLSQRGFSVSTGSACSAGANNPSRVMMAMGLDYERMGRVMRVSGGPETERKNWMDLAEALVAVGREM